MSSMDTDLFEPSTIPGGNDFDGVLDDGQIVQNVLDDEQQDDLEEDDNTDVVEAVEFIEEEDGQMEIPRSLSTRSSSSLKNETDKDEGSTWSEEMGIEVPAFVALRRKYQDHDNTSDEWRSLEKHVFVLSNAGKPVFTRHGSDEKLSAFMCIIQAIVSFLEDANDTVRYIVAGKHRIVFCIKGPLYLAAVASTDEPVSLLQSQLEDVHSQITSILTAGTLKMLEKNPNYDLRRLLTGAEKFIDSLLYEEERDLNFIMNSYQMFRLEQNTRTAIGKLIQSNRGDGDILFALLCHKHSIVSAVRHKKHPLHPKDWHLLSNFVNSSVSFRGSDTYTPICLPNFNAGGFLHAYISYIDPENCPELYLVLMTTKAELIADVAQSKMTIVEGLQANGSIQAIADAVEHQNYSVDEVGIPDLVHFVYKNNANHQLTMCALGQPFEGEENETMLLRRYQRMISWMQSSNEETPHRICFRVTDTEAILLWWTAGFTLITTFSPLISKAVAITACNRLLRWIKREEGGLFVKKFENW